MTLIRKRSLGLLGVVVGAVMALAATPAASAEEGPIPSASVDGDGTVDRVRDTLGGGAVEAVEERLGSVAGPDAQRALECMGRAAEQGGSAADALETCLGGGDSEGDDGSSGGGAGGGPGHDPNSVVEPDCGSDERVDPGGFVDPGEGDPSESGPEDVSDEELEKTRNWAVDSVDFHDQGAEDARKAGDEQLERAQEAASEAASDVATEAQEALDTEPGSDARGSAVEDVGEAYDAYVKAVNRVKAVLEAREDGSSAGKGQPGPGPGGIEGPESGGPRCEGPSARDHLHSEECASDLGHCIDKLTDPLYAETDGDCEMGPGPAGGETPQCDEDDSAGECFAEGGTPDECNPSGDDDPAGVTPGENDDIFEDDDEGSLGYGLLDVHSLGEFLDSLCKGAGLCFGDPPPTPTGASG